MIPNPDDTGGMTEPFWKTIPLSEMTPEQWESLCDGCARCCLIKLEHPDDGEIVTTRLVCPYLNLKTCQCSDYPNRSTLEPNCVQLTLERIHRFTWLPETCAYRLLAEGKELAWWHPLVSGDPKSVHRAGISVRGKAIPATAVPEDAWENFIEWDE